MASPAGQWLGVETDRAGRVKVQPDLSVPGHPNVFAIGDTAWVVAPTRNLFGLRRQEPVPLPGVAQPAIQEGKYVASVIRRRVVGLPPPALFCYWDKGNLAIVGRTFAVADVPPFRFWGVLAWFLWLGVHISSARDDQRGAGIPSVLVARRAGGGRRVVSGLCGVSSEAVPYL